MAEPSNMTPASQDALVDATTSARMERFAKRVGENVPLDLVATGTNPSTGKEEAVFEDPEGVTFAVPMEWLDRTTQTMARSSKSEDDFLGLPHTVISNAPPGELQKVWRAATEQAADESSDPRSSKYVEGGFGTGDTTTPYDKWLKERGGSNLDRVMQEGGFVRGGVPTSAEKSYSQPVANPVSLFNSTKPRAPSIRRKEDIPADAGSGWGQWNQVWNPRRQRWETPRSR